MSPENRTRSSLGPLPKRRAWLAGGTIASLALLLTAVASPATAVGQSTQTPPSVSVAGPSGDDECKQEGPDGHGGSEEPGGPGGSQEPGGHDGSGGSQEPGGHDGSQEPGGHDGSIDSVGPPPAVSKHLKKLGLGLGGEGHDDGRCKDGKAEPTGPHGATGPCDDVDAHGTGNSAAPPPIVRMLECGDIWTFLGETGPGDHA